MRVCAHSALLARVSMLASNTLRAASAVAEDRRKKKNACIGQPSVEIHAAEKHLAALLAAAVRAPQCPGVVPLGGLQTDFVVREYSAGVREGGREFLPLAGCGIAFHQGACWP